MLIGLTGYAGSGKSTVAKHLVERHGFVLVKFAGPLKAMVRALGLGEREIEGDLKEVPCRMLDGKTPRFAMQTLGTEWGREMISETLWVDAAMRIVDDVMDHGGKVVMDDLRFPNEELYVRMREGLIVKVVRPDTGPVNAHQSDNYEIRWKALINNSGTLEQLRRAADLLVEG